MGTYASIFEKNKQQAEANLLPTKSDFITGYADMTGRMRCCI